MIYPMFPFPVTLCNL